MKFSIALDLKTGLGFQFSTGFRLKDQCASLRSAHKIFQKKKKKKKESHSLKWKVSKKQVFLIKYYLIYHRKYGCESGKECFCETLWVEILSKTGGLNLLFCKPGTYLCCLIFLFFILISLINRHSIIGSFLKERELI